MRHHKVGGVTFGFYQHFDRAWAAHSSPSRYCTRLFGGVAGLSQVPAAHQGCVFLYGSRWPARHVMRVFHLLSALQERRCSPASCKAIWASKPSRKGRCNARSDSTMSGTRPAFTRIHGSVLPCGAPIPALRAKEVILTLFRRVDQALTDSALAVILMRLVSSSSQQPATLLEMTSIVDSRFSCITKCSVYLPTVSLNWDSAQKRASSSPHPHQSLCT